MVIVSALPKRSNTDDCINNLQIDVDNSGLVEKDEFIDWLLGESHKDELDLNHELQLIQAMWTEIDMDKNGMISPEELTSVVIPELDSATAASLITSSKYDSVCYHSSSGLTQNSALRTPVD